MQVLYEDNHCLAVSKPAGVLTMGFPGAPRTLIDEARDYLKKRYGKPGKVYLGVVHRLDKAVSGVVLFARTSKAARRLSEQFRLGKVEKVYWAIVQGSCRQGSGRFEDWLAKDRRLERVVVVPPHTPNGRHAIVDFRRLRLLHIAVSHGAPSAEGRSAAGRRVGRQGRRMGAARVGSGPHHEAQTARAEHLAGRLEALSASLLELRPRTGRTHQLRVQLASRGIPICGDRKYGSRHAFEGAIALHARRLVFEHPIRREPISVQAPLPERWQRWLGSAASS